MRSKLISPIWRFIFPPATAGSKLIFRTPVGGITLSPVTAEQLGVVDVSEFDRIRVVALLDGLGGAIEVILMISNYSSRLTRPASSQRRSTGGSPRMR
jgi:hypothetical protein